MEDQELIDLIYDFCATLNEPQLLNSAVALDLTNSGWKLSLIPEVDIRPKKHRLVIETASKCLIGQNKRILLAIILAQRLTRFNRGLKINSGRSKADRVAVAKKAANSRWGNR